MSSLRALVEQNEGIPVPRGRGGLVGRRVFKVSPRDRIQQRFVEQITLTFQFHVVEVFKVLVMDRVQLLHPLTHVTLRMRHPLPLPPPLPKKKNKKQKSARLGPHSGSELSADFSSSTLSAQQQSTSPAMERETWVDGDDVWVRVDSSVLEKATVRQLAMVPAVVKALTAARTIGWSFWWSPGLLGSQGCGCFSHTRSSRKRLKQPQQPKPKTTKQ